MGYFSQMCPSKECLNFKLGLNRMLQLSCAVMDCICCVEVVCAIDILDEKLFCYSDLDRFFKIK